MIKSIVAAALKNKSELKAETAKAHSIEEKIKRRIEGGECLFGIAFENSGQLCFTVRENSKMVSERGLIGRNIVWAEQEVDTEGKPVIKSADPITLVELLTSPSNSKSSFLPRAAV